MFKIYQFPYGEIFKSALLSYHISYRIILWISAKLKILFMAVTFINLTEQQSTDHLRCYDVGKQ